MIKLRPKLRRQRCSGCTELGCPMSGPWNAMKLEWSQWSGGWKHEARTRTLWNEKMEQRRLLHEARRHRSPALHWPLYCRCSVLVLVGLLALLPMSRWRLLRCWRRRSRKSASRRHNERAQDDSCSPARELHRLKPGSSFRVRKGGEKLLKLSNKCTANFHRLCFGGSATNRARRRAILSQLLT